MADIIFAPCGGKSYPVMQINIRKPSIKSAYSKLLAIITLCCVGGIIYSNTFHSSFHFDDTGSIVENVSIRHLTDLAAIWNFWPTRFITYLSLAINYHFNGLNVFGYHLFNLIVHLGSAFLVWWLALLTLSTPRMKDEKISDHGDLIALFIGLLFVAHPIQTQAVTYIIQRAASLATLFYLASLCLYVKSRSLDREICSPLIRKFYYGGSLVTAMLAMFTKEMAITLPLMFLLYEYCFLKTKKGLNWKPLIPFIITILIIPLVMLFTKSVNFMQMQRIGEDVPEISSWHYLLTQFRVMVTYIRLVFLPLSQRLEYDYPIAKALTDLPTLASLVVLIFILYFAKRIFNKYKLLTFSIFWFFLSLLPESSIIPIKDVIFEHRLYLPMVGYSFFLVSILYYLLGQQALRRMITILFIITISYSILAYNRNAIWENEFMLWSDTVRKSSQIPRPYIILGNAYDAKGEHDQAILNYNKAIQSIPNNARPYNSRGIAYAAKGDYDKAILDYDRAIGLDPKFAEAYNNRGVAYAAKGDYDKAISDYNKAIQLIPTLAHAYNNRGVAHVVKGNFAQAISDYDKAIKLNPNYAETYSNRGSLYFHEGNYDQAILDFNKAIQINRNDLEAYQIRASMYTKTGKYDKAISDYDKVIQINPDSEKAYYNRGTAYGYKGIYDQAISDFTHAISIKPDYLQAYTNRAVAYYHKRQYERAWEDVRRIISQGGEVNAEFLEALKQASGRER